MFDKLGTWNWELIAPVSMPRHTQQPSVPPETKELYCNA